MTWANQETMAPAQWYNKIRDKKNSRYKQVSWIRTIAFLTKYYAFIKCYSLTTKINHWWWTTVSKGLAQGYHTVTVISDIRTPNRANPYSPHCKANALINGIPYTAIQHNKMEKQARNDWHHETDKDWRKTKLHRTRPCTTHVSAWHQLRNVQKWLTYKVTVRLCMLINFQIILPLIKFCSLIQKVAQVIMHQWTN